jgi:hypothetical protein
LHLVQAARQVWVATARALLASGQAMTALTVLVRQQAAATSVLLAWRPAAALALLV